MESQATNDLPEIFKIECASENNDDLSYLTSEHQTIVKDLINKYNFSERGETEVKMAIILRDNESVIRDLDVCRHRKKNK